MTDEEIAAEVAALEEKLRPDIERLTRLKLTRRGRLAAKRSGEVRTAKIPEKKVCARREEIHGNRGHVALLAEEFGCSPRTIARKLGPRR